MSSAVILSSHYNFRSTDPLHNEFSAFAEFKANFETSGILGL